MVLELDSIEKDEALAMLRFRLTLKLRAVLPESRNKEEPVPVPTFNELHEAFTSKVTVCPLEIVTSLLEVGTPLGIQMLGSLQLPVVPDILL